MGRILTLGLLLAFSLSAEPAYITFPADIDWVTRSSDHFDVLYRRGEDALAIRAIKAAERARTVVTPLFADLPERVWIVLADFNDTLNGYALDVLYPHMVIYTSPPEPSSELASLDDWFSSVILHEFTHNVHLFPAHGLWAPLRFLFGSIAAPNGLMPSHFHEGLAVFTETEFTRGGRGRGTYFAMLRRMAVDAKEWGTEKFFSVDQMDGSTPRWPHGTTSYFMGSNLYRDLWKRKGAEGIKDFVYSTSQIVPYFLNHSYETVFGESYQSVWDKIFDSTRLLDELEIQRIQATPLSATEAITTTHFMKGDLHLSPSGKLIAFRSFSPDDGAKFEILSTEKKTAPEGISSKVHDLDGKIGGAAGLCWGSSETDLLVAIQRRERSYAVNELVALNWKSGDQTPILTDGQKLTHVREIACTENLDRLVVTTEYLTRGEVAILSYDPLTHTATKIESWPTPPGTFVSGLTIQNNRIAIAIRRGVQTDFYIWKRGTPPTLARTADGLYYNLRPLDGEAFLSIAQTDGRDEIWIIDPDRNTQQKHAAFLGGVTSFDWKNRSLVALNYRHGGYDVEKVTPVSLPAKPLGTEKKPDTPTMTEVTASEPIEYSPVGSLTPKTWVPLFFFVPFGFEIGFWIPGFDISQRHFFDLIGGYDSRGSFFANAGYSYRRRHSIWNLNAGYLPSYFYYTNGEVKLARDGITLSHTYNILDGSSGAWAVKTSLVFSQLSLEYKITPPIPSKTLNSVGAGLETSFSLGLKKKPLFISPTSGTVFGFGGTYFPTAIGSTEEYSRLVATIDQYLPSLFSGHSIFLGHRASWTHGTEVLNS
ncbi:MAG: hypothetical protein HYR96_14420 [Deltaproteobacteria bacterium]|nr:hypothetical protein [Deltaproteobacteria bacterium]